MKVTPDQIKSQKPDEPKKTNLSNKLVTLARQHGELFHTDDRKGYITVRDGAGETLLLTGSDFKDWLLHQAYIVNETATYSSTVVDTAVDQLKSKALFGSDPDKVWIRKATLNGKDYLDLNNSSGEVIEMSADGWKVITNPPVKFIRPKASLPLPKPLPSKDGLNRLFRYVNLQDQKEKVLYTVCLLQAMRPKGPYNITAIDGVQGSCKSTASKIFRRYVDPNVAPLQSFPRNEQELMVSAINEGILMYDNISSIPDWLSDSLCRISTEGGFKTRQLYKDSEQLVFNVCLPILINGIGEVITKPDLVNRTVALHLKELPEGQRKTEEALWKELEKDDPYILGALLDVYVSGLGNLPETTVTNLPRMADFAKWGTACEKAMGLKEGEFMKLYGANIGDANSSALEASPVGMAVEDLMENLEKKGQRKWQGTAGDLLNIFTANGSKKFPIRGTNILGNKLNEVTPILKKVQIIVKKEKTNKKRTIIITNSRGENWYDDQVSSPVEALSSSNFPNNNSLSGGDSGDSQNGNSTYEKEMRQLKINQSFEYGGQGKI